MHGSSMLPAKKKKQVWLLNGKFHPTGAYVDLLAGRQTCQYVYLCIHVYSCVCLGFRYRLAVHMVQYKLYTILYSTTPPDNP